MPKTIPQSKRLKMKDGFDIVTVKDGKGNEIRQRYVKRKGFVEAVREATTTDKPKDKDATGTGGRRRDTTVMDAVDAMQTGIDEADKRKR